jgi:hypothetical protein
MEAGGSSEMLVNMYIATCVTIHNITIEISALCENLISHMFVILHMYARVFCISTELVFISAGYQMNSFA